MPTTAPAQIRRPRQSELPIHVAVRRALMPMKAAMWFLERDEDHILSIIPDRIRWAFDIHCRGERAMVVIFRGSAEHCRALDLGVGRTGVSPVDGPAPSLAAVPPELETIDEVIDSVLPKRAALRAVEVKNLFRCNQGHIANLIEAKLLVRSDELARPSTDNRSPLVTRASVCELLKARRFLP
jgi:hypothetical protein